VASWVFDDVSASADGAPGAPAATLADDAPGLVAYVDVGGLWWDRVHVFPRRVDAGNIVTQATFDFVVVNAYIDDAQDWDALAIDASGVSLDNPTLPATLQPLENLLLTLTISPEGLPTVEGDLTLTFGDGAVVVVPITLNRIIALPFAPEVGVVEELEWLTHISEAASGKERRQALRQVPRQHLRYRVFREDGPERQRLENILFAHQGRPVAPPFWPDQTLLSAAASIGATTLQLVSTDYRDIREGGLAYIWASETEYEIVTVDTVDSSTQVTLASPTTIAFEAGAHFIPARVAIVLGNSQSRRHVGSAEYDLDLQVVDNGDSLASTSGWPTYNSKVLVSDVNFGEEIRESYQRATKILDGLSGAVQAVNLNDVSRRTSFKEWVTESQADLWAVRRLLHALRGRQVSFYIPTDAAELTPTQPLAMSATNLDVVNAGYTEHTQARQPRDRIRVVLADGTTYERRVVSSSELSADEERLVVDSAWPASVALADILRVDVIEKARLDADRVRIEYRDLVGAATIVVPVRSVLE